MIYALDLWSSYIYAGVAARVASYLKNRNKELSSLYEKSAAKAVEWAEKRNAAKEDAETWTEWAVYKVNHSRNLAAIEMYRLTGEKKYVDAAVQACQFTAGANPLYTVFTTGIGHKSVENLLHHDSRRSGQKVPSDISPYGNFDASIHMDHWVIKLIENKEACIPHVSQWPATEDYFDVYIFPEQTEWTMHQIMSPKAYVLGYQATRK